MLHKSRTVPWFKQCFSLAFSNNLILCHGIWILFDSEQKVSLAGLLFARLESQVSCLEIWSNPGSFLSDPFYVVLLARWYGETKDCSVAGETKICDLYRAPVPADYPSAAGSRAFRVGTISVNCIWCEKGKGVGNALFQKTVCGASEWSIYGAQRKNKLETRLKSLNFNL